MDHTDEKMLEAKIRDLFTIARKNREHRASNFLDPGQQKMAEGVARIFPDMAFHFDGGYGEAERRIMVVCPEFLKEEPFHAPLGALRMTPKDPDEHPGHRDFLGAVLGLGISREKVGDILVTKTGADVIVKQEITEYIGLNLLKVGSTPVLVEEISLKELLKPERSYKEMKSTVASLRLDAIASLAFGISRSKMAPFIKGENIRLNFRVVKDPSTPVKEGDVISASRLGRAKVVEVGGQSKKGRIYVRVHRYIS
ncbi:MAG TPA: RNA-binding protein [Thermoanaerobacterales bacterium]|nr:RNA-binding protein [Thermoanaerobacterales bacterium]